MPTSAVKSHQLLSVEPGELGVGVVTGHLESLQRWSGRVDVDNQSFVLVYLPGGLQAALADEGWRGQLFCARNQDPLERRPEVPHQRGACRVFWFFSEVIRS